jgi:hypothetical protein
MWFYIALLFYILGAINTYRAAREMELPSKQCLIAGVVWPILSLVNLWEDWNAK